MLRKELKTLVDVGNDDLMISIYISI